VLLVVLLPSATTACFAGARAALVAPQAAYPVSMSENVRGPDGAIVPPESKEVVGSFGYRYLAWGMFGANLTLSGDEDISAEVNRQVAAHQGEAITNLSVRSSGCAWNVLSALASLGLLPGCTVVDLDGLIVRRADRPTQPPRSVFDEAPKRDVLEFDLGLFTATVPKDSAARAAIGTRGYGLRLAGVFFLLEKVDLRAELAYHGFADRGSPGPDGAAQPDNTVDGGSVALALGARSPRFTFGSASGPALTAGVHAGYEQLFDIARVPRDCSTCKRAPVALAAGPFVEPSLRFTFGAGTPTALAFSFRWLPGADISNQALLSASIRLQ
jgi:hypothetical protein